MTLSTRAKDGGIDVEKVKIVQNTIFIGEWFLSTDAFIRLISAHTRERCAKWHIDQRNKILKIANSEKDPQRQLLLISIADEHVLSADAHRKMED